VAAGFGHEYIQPQGTDSIKVSAFLPNTLPGVGHYRFRGNAPVLHCSEYQNQENDNHDDNAYCHYRIPFSLRHLTQVTA
jgi:hypothetical protein